MERLMDRGALVQLDRAEVRRRNFIRSGDA
jgi:hypothetical protein